MVSLGGFLDTLTLFLALSYALSALVAFLPNPDGDASFQEREATRRLVFPPLGAAAMIFLGFISSWWDAWRRVPDHCGLAPIHPMYPCWLHPEHPATAVSSLEMGTNAILVLAACGLAFELVRWAQARLQLGGLARLADRKAGKDVAAILAQADVPWPGEVLVVPSQRPLCFVFGIRRPRLVLSSLVVTQAPASTLQSIVAHELAHLSRRDLLRRLVYQLVALLHLPGYGQRAYARWTFAGEVVCDETAARRVGSPLPIAESLVQLERLRRQPGPVAPLGSASFADEAVSTRVRSLLAPVASSPTQRFIRPWPWVVLALFTSQVGLVHAALEGFLRILHQ